MGNACPCIVMVPDLEEALVEGATVYWTVPGPVPLAVVRLIQVALLVAVHAQPSGGVTAMAPVPPALLKSLLDV